MAKTPKGVLDLLNKIWEPTKKLAQQEVAELKKIAEAKGDKFELEPWDWRYYSEILRKEKYGNYKRTTFYCR